MKIQELRVKKIIVNAISVSLLKILPQVQLSVVPSCLCGDSYKRTGNILYSPKWSLLRDTSVIIAH